MSKRPRTPAQIKAEIERLKNELNQAAEREGQRLGALAVKAGLHEVEASDADILSALREVASRFRAPAEKQVQTA